ncbi:MAG: MAPEG family protein [Candidatus Binataceae bacterium]
MPHMMNDAAFRAYAIACSILVLKMSAAALMTAATRSRVKQFLNPEDARVLGGAGVMQEHPDVMRMLRMHRNDLENILPFFTVGLIFVLMGVSAFGAQVYFYTFTAARIVHTITYVAKMQPWRTVTFVVGLLCTVGMVVQILIAAL